MKTYPSKLLLFGEYTIINGSRALAVPYAHYAGNWAIGAEPDDRLLAFAAYLAEEASLQAQLDTRGFHQAVQAGLYFASNIPTGYGLGSSGALCAAVYDKYAFNQIGKEEVNRFGLLRQQLATMERHFHGSSSGTDPLICYLQHPVMIHSEGIIKLVDLPDFTGLPYSFFLLDTGISRSTGPLVKHYLAKCEQPAYKRNISNVLNPQVDLLIDNFLQAEWSRVEEGMKKVSQLQWTHFQEMIPDDLKSIWQQGLAAGAYTLKLCGAGGGGFLLGMAANEVEIENLKTYFPCEKIW